MSRRSLAALVAFVVLVLPCVSALKEGECEGLTARTATVRAFAQLNSIVRVLAANSVPQGSGGNQGCRDQGEEGGERELHSGHRAVLVQGQQGAQQ